jgi:CheY-like chemotaxis protein
MKKILIVDDRPEIRELVAMTLRIGPHQILHAGSGPEAIQVAQREKPDLILLDVMLAEGEMNGFEVCRHIKGDEETRNCYVVMLTARDEQSDIEEGFSSGANDYFVKPFSPLELLVKVDQVMGIHGASSTPYGEQGTPNGAQGTPNGAQGTSNGTHDTSRLGPVA